MTPERRGAPRLGGAARARALVREHLAVTVVTVRPLAGGEFSRAFAVTTAERAYVVRLSAAVFAAEAFAKDAYAARHFASPAVPIPPLLVTGPTTSGAFAISERAAGRRLAAWPAATRRALLPIALDTLAAIGRTDVSATQGYGSWGGDGHGRFPCWRDFLAAVIENHTDGFYRDWHDLFRASFLERDVYEALYQRMLRLAEFCPEERALLHNDFHFDNVLSDGRRVTGVIDWANACYGDPLYDAAWVRWWLGNSDDGNLVVQEFGARHGAAPCYDERIACYTYHLGLDDLRFYARTGRRVAYEAARDRLLRLAMDTER